MMLRKTIRKILREEFVIKEGGEPKSSSEIKSFQDWMDDKHPFWIKDTDGKYKNLRKGPPKEPNRHIKGKGYGVFGPSTQGAWDNYGSEFLRSKPNTSKSKEFPYNKLESNPSSQFIAYIIKKSYGGTFGNDKEAWAEAAFNAINSRNMYDQVAKFLGKDPYEFISSFMDTNVKYHKQPIISNYSSLFPELVETSCTPNILKSSNWNTLYKFLTKRKMIYDGEPLIIIWGPTQTLYYTKDGKTSSLTTKVSTGANGFGNTEDDKKTSTGLLKVSGKISGKDYEVLVGKTPTGKILGPNVDSTRVDDEGKRHIAEVLTAILELTGLEECNKNTLSRNIYIHGTNRESLLGSKRSNGCVRVNNNVIKKLLSEVKTGTKVYIYPD